jgi:putative transcriptional regulator
MAKKLLAAFGQALAHAKKYGRRTGRPAWLSPSPDEIRALRNKLKLTQKEFADRFGFDLTTVRNWEQARTQPQGANCLYLKMIQVDPTTVIELVDKVEKKEARKSLEPA